MDDLCFAENLINDCNVALKQNEFDALVSFVFSIGTKLFRISTLKKLLEAGKISEVKGEFEKWIYKDGIESAVLINRRKKERELFLK